MAIKQLLVEAAQLSKMAARILLSHQVVFRLTHVDLRSDWTEEEETKYFPEVVQEQKSNSCCNQPAQCCVAPPTLQRGPHQPDRPAPEPRLLLLTLHTVVIQWKHVQIPCNWNFVRILKVLHLFCEKLRWRSSWLVLGQDQWDRSNNRLRLCQPQSSSADLRSHLPVSSPPLTPQPSHLVFHQRF